MLDIAHLVRAAPSLRASCLISLLGFRSGSAAASSPETGRARCKLQGARPRFRCSIFRLPTITLQPGFFQRRRNLSRGFEVKCIFGGQIAPQNIISEERLGCIFNFDNWDVPPVLIRSFLGQQSTRLTVPTSDRRYNLSLVSCDALETPSNRFFLKGSRILHQF